MFASEGERSLLQDPVRANVLGVGISAITMEQAVDETCNFIQSGGKGYICVTGVHGVTEAHHDPEMMRILNHSFLTTPDGMPTVWVGKLQGLNIERVYGPDFMVNLCQAGVARGFRHFFYGGKDGVAELLQERLTERIPGLQVVGTYTPPFRPLLVEERESLAQQIRDCRPHLLWVGLSTPKQEKFMAEFMSLLDVQVMAGVGAAFDIHTGGIQDAPASMKRLGLQWLHRVIQEPRRLARRYFVGNLTFLWLILMQFLGLRRYEIKRDRTTTEGAL